MGGNSSDGLYEKYKLFYNSAIDLVDMKGITIVKSVEKAK